MSEDLLHGLTDEQQSAVTHGVGPCLVIAGAGTGKTRVLTHRLAHLVEKGIAKPDEILALTFTEKAATEMQERVDTLLPLGTNTATITTFHSFTNDILRRYAHFIGLPGDFTLLTSEEEVVFLRDHLFELPLKILRPSNNPTRFLQEIARFFSQLNDQAISSEMLAEWAGKHLADEDGALADQAAQMLELSQALAVYERLLRDNGYLTFGHCITETLRLFDARPSVLAEINAQYRFVMIDEYQDTNWAQTELAARLAGKGGNLMVVGDDDQSIYGFRGAASQSLIEFRTRFPNTTTVVLRHNFRSTQAILDSAYRLIQQNNPDRLEYTAKVDKRLLSEIAGEAPSFIYYSTLSSELSGITDQVQTWLEAEIEPQEIAILTRTYQQAKSVELALSRAGIAVNQVQAEPLFEVDLVRGVLAFLELLLNQHNNVACTEVFQLPPFEIPAPVWRQLCLSRPYQDDSLWELIEKVAAEGPTWLPDTARRRFQKAIDLHGELLGRASEAASSVFLQYVHRSGLYLKLTKSKRPTAEIELAVLGQLFDEMQAYEERHRRADLANFLRYIRVLEEIGQDVPTAASDQADPFAVNIMTVHKSKGLEFTAVLIPFSAQGRFPSQNRQAGLKLPAEVARTVPDDHVQEERRLYYVAMTRARRHLAITAASQYGQSSRKSKISPFVIESLPTVDFEKLAPQAVPPAEYLQASLDLPATTPAVTMAGGDTSWQKNVSYSSLNTYMECPWRYRYAYVLRIRTWPSQNLSFGNSIHDTLRAYFDARNRGLSPTLAELLPNYWRTAGYETRAQERQRFAEGIKALEAIEEEMSQTKPKLLEWSFQFPLTNGQRVTGRIDRVDELPDGSLAIVDYKTGHPKEESAVRKDVQLGIYILATETLIKKPVATVTLDFVMNREKVTVPRDKFALDDVAERVTTAAKELEADRQNDNFTAKPDMMTCSYCEYKHLCPFRYNG